MNKKNVMVIAITGIVCLVLATAFAGIGMCQYGETKAKEAAATTAPVKVNNTICPVTGNKVDMNNPITVAYKGKIYNLCCAMCLATFNSDPEKYSKIAEEQAIKK
jgi:YHS domain-containing protein